MLKLPDTVEDPRVEHAERPAGPRSFPLPEHEGPAVRRSNAIPDAISCFRP
jgi:hypothetical protein